MGLVKKGDAEATPAEAPEDPPVVKQLKELDDKYLELEKEYDREVQKLLVKFSALQQPLLEERKQVLLTSEGDGPTTGTPALSGFWLKAMQHHPNFEDFIQEWDEPVMEFLQDITKAHADEEDSNKGFKLVFHFSENPYFTNLEIEKSYTTKLTNPYCGEIDVQEIKCTPIEWKAGKDVTVERVTKKAKGGGAKKAKQKKEQEVPRPSFFRDFFRDLSEDMVILPEDARDQARALADEDPEDDEDDVDDQGYAKALMDVDLETGCALRDNIIPFAVRWYTGEAAPEEDEDDDDDEDDEEEDDEDDEDDDDDDEPPLKGRGKGKAQGRGGPGGKKKPGKASPETKPAEAPKEECKQQ